MGQERSGSTWCVGDLPALPFWAVVAVVAADQTPLITVCHGQNVLLARPTSQNTAMSTYFLLHSVPSRSSPNITGGDVSAIMDR